MRRKAFPFRLLLITTRPIEQVSLHREFSKILLLQLTVLTNLRTGSRWDLLYYLFIHTSHSVCVMIYGICMQVKCPLFYRKSWSGKVIGVPSRSEDLYIRHIGVILKLMSAVFKANRLINRKCLSSHMPEKSLSVTWQRHFTKPLFNLLCIPAKAFSSIGEMYAVHKQRIT